MQTLKLSGGLVSAHENDKEIALAVNCAKNDNFSMEIAYFLVRFQNTHSFTQCLLLFITNETSANKWRRILKSAKKKCLSELGSEVQ